MTDYGIDYAYGNGVTTSQIKAAEKKFVGRYLDWLPNGKVINATEASNILKAGLSLVLVWESTGHEGGFATGAADAKEADRQATALGMTGAVIFFGIADYDATQADFSALAEYLRGAASVITKARVGFYGGIKPMSAMFDLGVTTYGWQTYAWSSGLWDTRAHLQQYRNGVKIGPCEADLDRAIAADYGQWPRPVPTRTTVQYVTDGTLSLKAICEPHTDSPLKVVARTILHGPHPRLLFYVATHPSLRARMPKGIRIYLRVK